MDSSVASGFNPQTLREMVGSFTLSLELITTPEQRRDFLDLEPYIIDIIPAFYHYRFDETYEGIILLSLWGMRLGFFEGGEYIPPSFMNTIDESMSYGTFTFRWMYHFGQLSRIARVSLP